jgi:signal transduction histidine kinase
VVRRPATPLEHITARIAVALRAGVFVVGGSMAVLTAGDVVGPRWVVPTVIAYGVWAGVFAWVGLTRGLVRLLVAGDLAITVVLCLCKRHLVPPDSVVDGSGWVAVAGSACVTSLSLAWRARAAIPAGLAVVAAFAAGFRPTGLSWHGAAYTAAMVVQLLGASAVMAVVRRAGAAADAELAAATQARREVTVAEARRADESAQLRLLHDTALTTLTLVGTGVVERSDSLAARAAADLAAIHRLGAVVRPAPEGGLVRLDELLDDVARRTPGQLRVQRVLVPCLVPIAVADAFARSSAEALTNSARHAGVDTAVLSLATALERIRVEISDNGRGFDPDAAAATRYGVRESIVGRMAAVGGSARVESAPDEGTRWTLEWSALDQP